MDLTEAFRSEDISKTDFFDFVVTPDSVENQQSIHFNRTLKSMGIFIDNPDESNNNTNTGSNTTTTNNNSNASNEFHDPKEETNNNHLMLGASEMSEMNSVVGSFPDHPFWSTGCDKETVRLETAILEDLNKFCWNQDQEVAVNTVGGKEAHNNTDGAIYTLTVLNGDHPSATWYRPPEATQQLLKDNDNNQPSPHDLHPHQNPPQSSSLDLDSILSIIPPAPTHSQNGHHYPQNGFQTGVLAAHLENVKSEYSYEESGYSTKDSNGVGGHMVDNHLLEGDSNFNNNNNDWKLNNNNHNSNGSNSNGASNAESLLRSALQGKSFLGRYNGPPKNDIKVMDGHTELRRALSTPPNGSKTPLDQSPAFMNGEDELDMKHHSPLLVMDQSGGVIYDEARVLGIVDSDNPSSTHSMDDILLSQLDSASYPEDYEKLKRIANEVAESVNHYCSLDPAGSPQAIYLNTHLTSDLAMTANHTLSPATATAKPAKKFSKKQANGTKTVHNNPVHSNGVRKERSLHYCSICSKGFKDKYSVNVHIRTHTGEKPFACSLCGKSFRQKAHLAKHYQTHIAQKNATTSGNNGGAPKAGNKRFVTAKTT